MRSRGGSPVTVFLSLLILRGWRLFEKKSTDRGDSGRNRSESESRNFSFEIKSGKF
jgi:hypothetical protein